MADPQVQEGLNWLLGGGLSFFLIKSGVRYFLDRAKRQEKKTEKKDESRLSKIEKSLDGVNEKLREIEITIVKHDVSELKDSIKELSTDIQELSETLAGDRARIEAENKGRDAAILEMRGDIKAIQGARHGSNRGGQ